MSNFRIGVGDPTHHTILGVHSIRPRHQSVERRVLGLSVRRMSELKWRANISGCENPFVRCAMVLVNRDASLVVLDSGRLKTEVFQIGNAPGRHHDLIDDHFVFMVAVLNHAVQSSFALFYFLQLRSKAHVDAFFFEHIEDNFTSLRIIFVHDLLAALKDSDVGTQPLHRMSQLAPDRPATDDHEIFRLFGQAKK